MKGDSKSISPRKRNILSLWLSNICFPKLWGQLCPQLSSVCSKGLVQKGVNTEIAMGAKVTASGCHVVRQPVSFSKVINSFAIIVFFAWQLLNCSTVQLFNC